MDVFEDTVLLIFQFQVQPNTQASLNLTRVEILSPEVNFVLSCAYCYNVDNASPSVWVCQEHGLKCKLLGSGLKCCGLLLITELSTSFVKAFCVW